MSHAEFIEKMARYKPIHAMKLSPEHTNQCYTAIGKPFGMDGPRAWSAVDFYERHKADPQIPSLGDVSHLCVCDLTEHLDLSSSETMRAGLIKSFSAELPTGKINHRKHAIGNALLRRIMEASELKWFERDGTPFIHWNQKP